MNIRPILAATLLASAGFAQAATVFTDNFDSNAPGTDVIPTGWLTPTGSVDVIGNGFYDYLPGTGLYVDLLGSQSVTGTLERSFFATAGLTYTASFQLAGGHVPVLQPSGLPYGPDTVDVTFGTSSGSYVLNQPDPFATKTLTFTAFTSGNVTLKFANQGSDNAGALLDNVSVTAVPEPEGYAMLLAGLGVLGFMSRRRRSK